MAVTSAGPYTSLHLAPDRKPRQHPTALSVCVYLMVTNVSCAKKVGPIEMPSGAWTCRAPRNHILGGGSDLSGGRDRLLGVASSGPL